MHNHCTQLKFHNPDEIAPGITEWIEANPVLDTVTEVIQITVMEPVAGGLQISPNQPNMRYVFSFFVFWTSKEPKQEAVVKSL
jgi:hypothetical protein